MKVVRIASSGAACEFRLKSSRLTSQTKPGPNMAFAVARKVARKDSMLEKEAEMRFSREGEMGEGVGERVEKKEWLFQAMEAWLKREAWVGERAYSTRMSLVGRVASLVSEGFFSKVWWFDFGRAGGCTGCHFIKAVDEVALIVSPCCDVGLLIQHIADAMFGKGFIVGELRDTMEAPSLRFRIV